jgi:hypothetical protein
MGLIYYTFPESGASGLIYYTFPESGAEHNGINILYIS